MQRYEKMYPSLIHCDDPGYVSNLESGNINVLKKCRC